MSIWVLPVFCVNLGPSRLHVRRGLDGRGEIIAITDTGIDWDNCFVWESARSPTFPNRGQPPPFNTLDKNRRAIIAYDYITDCSKCGMCPIRVVADRREMRGSGALLMASESRLDMFPQDQLLSAHPSRDYDSGGAAVEYEIKAITTGFPSEFVAQGAGAFDIPSKVSVAVLRRVDLPKYQATGDSKLCLNDCLEEGNVISTPKPVDLPASTGGYAIIIKNLGALGAQTDSPAHIQLTGYLQMLTARKPCGDEADDDMGHGTHVVGVATGEADTPPALEDKKRAAATSNGVAPAAQLIFHDIMQNGDVACLSAGDEGGICNKVNRVTPPLDLQRDLFAKAHNAGARVHLNAWGCKVPAGEAAEYCNYYGSDAADMDAFMHANPESLVVTAVGDAGGHILKSCCFVSLNS